MKCEHGKATMLDTSDGPVCVECMNRHEVLAVAMAILGEPCRVLYDARKPRVGGFTFRRTHGFYVANVEDCCNLVLRVFEAARSKKPRGVAIIAWLRTLTLRLDLARAVAEKGLAL